MANSQAVSVQFKQDMFTGVLPGGISTLKAALFLASATKDGTTTAYSATGEVSGTNYTAGGVAVTAATAPAVTGTTVYWTPSASIVYTNVTLSTAFDCLQIYDTARANKAIGTWTFGSQTITAGTLTFTMPTNDSANALLRA
jgi:hypothetical protein